MISFNPLTPRGVPLSEVKGNKRTLSSLGSLIHAGRMNIMYYLNRSEIHANIYSVFAWLQWSEWVENKIKCNVNFYLHSWPLC